MPSHAPRVSSFRKRMSVGLLVAVLALTGAPVGGPFTDQAAAGGKSSDGGGKVSAYGKKVRR